MNALMIFLSNADISGFFIIFLDVIVPRFCAIIIDLFLHFKSFSIMLIESEYSSSLDSNSDSPIILDLSKSYCQFFELSPTSKTLVLKSFKILKFENFIKRSKITKTAHTKYFIFGFEVDL